MELFKATEAMKANQSKGKAWKKKKESERSYTSPYETTYKSFNEEYSLAEVKSLYGFLNKQKTLINKYNVDTDNLPTHQYLDWLDSGANAALVWSQEILKSKGILKTGEALEVIQKNKEETGRFVNVAVSKSSNEELMQATFVVLEPHSSDEEFDLHGDTNSEEEVRKACHNFNTYSCKANLLHLADTDTFAFVESYIAPVDFILGEEFVKKGTWLATIQVFDEEIWELVKSRYFTGLSIQGLARTEMLSDNEEVE